MVAKTIQQFLKEAQGPESIDVLKAAMLNLGYKDQKAESSTRFSVLVDGSRVEILKQIANSLAEFGAVYDPNFGSSSVGMVRIGKYAIGAKPKSRQGKASAGVENEYTLVNMINEALKNGPLNITFVAGRKKFTIVKATKAVTVGGDTAGRKKSDVNVMTVDGDAIPLSLKKDGAEMWESADSYWGDDMKKIATREQKAGNVVIEPHPTVKSVFTITPNLAVKANPKETQAVVFGSDLLGKGCVLEKTFTGAYKVDAETETVYIEVSNILTSMSELKGDYEVYFLIRNDSSRKGSKIPGLRVLAVKKSRINKNVVVVKR